MSEHDVPAERDERDELRRNFAAWLDEWGTCPACDVQLQRSTGTEFVPWHRHDDDCVLAAILALLAAARPAPGTREPTQAEIDDACMWYRHDFGLMSDEDAGRLRFTAREWLRAWHKAGARELLGAPAPAEGRQVLALDAIRDVLGIDYDEDSAMWYLPAEPAPIECATLDDALRAYAKMAAPVSGEPSGAEADDPETDRNRLRSSRLLPWAKRRCKPDFFAQTYEPADPAGEPSGSGAVVREAPWTDVNDGLPGEQGCDSENVLVFLNGHVGIHDMEGRKGGGWGIRIGFYDAERRAFRVHGGIEPFVTHWMPLPQAPTAPEEGESDAE